MREPAHGRLLLSTQAVSHELVRQVESVSLTTTSRYRIKRKFFSVFERTFRVFTFDGQLLMLIQHPIFRFREEFIVYRDEAKQRPMLSFKARQIVAINFSYDIVDNVSGELLGTVQKRGLRSLVRDKFKILDPAGEEIGYMEERGASLLRRFIPLLLSHHYVEINGKPAAEIRQIFRFFTREYEVVMAPGVEKPQFVLACAMLALMAEAHRER